MQTGTEAGNGGASGAGATVPVGALSQVWKSETASIRSSSSLKGRSVTYGDAGVGAGLHATAGGSFGVISGSSMGEDQLVYMTAAQIRAFLALPGQLPTVHVTWSAIRPGHFDVLLPRFRG